MTVTIVADGSGIRKRTLKNGRVVWDVSYNVDGRKFGKRGFPTKKAAGAYRRAQLHASDRGAFVEPSGITFGAYLNLWLDSLVKQRPSTRSTYRRNIEARILSPRVRPQLVSIPLQKLRSEDLSSLWKWLVEEDGISPNSVRLVHTIVKAALKVAVMRGYLMRNVAEHAEVPGKRRREIKTWSPDQTKSFLEVARDDRNFAAWRLLVTTGLRRGELFGLQWHDLDLTTGRISIRRSSDGWIVGETKTGKQRAWRLDAETLDVLRAHKKAMLAERFARGQGRLQDADAVFTMPSGRALQPRFIFLEFQRLTKQASVPSIRIHDLRHGAATLALGAGIHPKVVSEMLGHSSVAITMDLYSHVTPTVAADAAGRIAALLTKDAPQR